MKQAQGEIRAALYTRLKAALPIPVYSTSPRNAEYPKAIIGHILPTDDSSKDAPGQKFEIMIHFWDKFTGSENELDGYVNDASVAITGENSTTYTPLVLTSFRVFTQNIEGEVVAENPDNTIKHKVLQMSLRTREKEA